VVVVVEAASVARVVWVVVDVEACAAKPSLLLVPFEQAASPMTEIMEMPITTQIRPTGLLSANFTAQSVHST
jgi:hypothetical protein